VIENMEIEIAAVGAVAGGVIERGGGI